MTPQERDLILNVFDRLSRIAGGAKDREAEALIHERMRAIPDSAYNLVEAVVVQEQAITERDERIALLERQLAGAPQPQAQPAAGFGRPANPWGRGSVPQVPPQQQAAYGQQQYPQQQPGPWGGQPAGGGSFLRTAAGAAVGVAGGMLLANSISSMFAGGHGAALANQVSDTAHGAVNSVLPGTPEPQPQYDTNIADDGGYDSGGWDDGGGDSF